MKRAHTYATTSAAHLGASGIGPFALGLCISLTVHAGVLLTVRSLSVGNSVDSAASPMFRSGREANEPIHVRLTQFQRNTPATEPELARLIERLGQLSDDLRPAFSGVPQFETTDLSPVPTSTFTALQLLAHPPFHSAQPDRRMHTPTSGMPEEVLPPYTVLIPDVELPATADDTHSDVQNAGVDRGVAVLDLPTPRYPAASRRLGEQGLVILRVWVDAAGAVMRVTVVQSPGHRRLVRAAIDAVQRARFQPALRDGRAIASNVLVPIRFRLDE